MSGTVVKANWKQIPKGNAAKAGQVRAHMKKGMDYYQHRPDEEGTRADRVAFTGDKDKVTREEVGQVIDEAGGRYAYRMVMSPNPEQKMNEVQLREWTREVMREAGAMHRMGEYTAVAHTKQTDQPHVHVVAISETKMKPEDFKALREVGDREQQRIFERDGVGQQKAGREVERPRQTKETQGRE
ncbi:MAG: hypothetical protein RLZZ156_486 [Deinococcota bacterium]|jgi:CheY-like chemotaxis protein